jgi:23S rRNA pseudouridine1911/1915/1917 synthase
VSDVISGGARTSYARRAALNTGFEYRERVGPEAAGRTVLTHLARRYRHSSKGVWRERIAAGEVRLQGALATATDVLQTGQSLVWRRPPWEEPPVPLCFAVLYLDDHLLAVAKPRGLPSIPHGGLYLTHTLLHRVRRRWPEATPVHRLGRGTSGLLLFARTPDARRNVAAAWREGRVEKTYRALVAGVPERETFSVDRPIGPVPHPELGQVYALSESGKPSLSHVRRLEARDGAALVEVSIPTGRPHQIRIHLAAAGHPLVGDPLYAEGGLPREEPGLPGEGGFWLHSFRLRLDHPATGLPLELECGPPPPLREPDPA